jgi:hypothetical protein
VSKPAGYERSGVADEAELRTKTQHAPLVVKLGIDRDRERRGLPPLWRECRSKPTGRVYVFGCAAPGVSVPVAAALDGELVPERVLSSAYAVSIRDAKLGKIEVSLVDGHGQGAAVLATTDDDSLVLSCNDITGLVIRASLHVREHAEFLADVYGGRVGLSISFRPRRMAIEQDRRVRVVSELELVNVAAIREHKEQGRPAYRHARLYAALADDPAAVRRARTRAIAQGLAAIYKRPRE